MRSLAFALALILPACAGAEPREATHSAESVAAWRALDADAGQIRDIDGLEQLAQDFPDSSSVRLRLLQPYLAAGEVEKIMETLEWLYDRGYVFSDVARQQIPRLLEGVDPGRIAERLRAEGEVINASEVIATVPAEARLVESVVRDPAYGRLLVSTVYSRKVMVLGNEGQLVPLELAGADNLTGMVVTPDGKHIFVSSANIDGSQRDPSRFAGLMSLRPGTTGVARISAPDSVNPSDLTVGSDGTFFVSDPVGGGVYTAATGETVLSPLISPGTLRSPQGLATSEDGSKLYVSDYRYGIAIVDLETREVSRLSTELLILLDGVDGLLRHDNELIAVQNGTSPMRISAFELSDDGFSVIGHRVLEQAHPDWTEPLGASIDGDGLIYVATGQWDRYIEGEPAQDKPPLPTQIRRLPLK